MISPVPFTLPARRSLGVVWSDAVLQLVQYSMKDMNVSLVLKDARSTEQIDRTWLPLKPS